MVGARAPESIAHSIRNTARNTSPLTKMMAFIGLSCRKCMKNSATSDAFRLAIKSAITVFAAPKSCPAASTVSTVSVTSAPSTFKYVLPAL